MQIAYSGHLWKGSQNIFLNKNVLNMLNVSCLNHKYAIFDFSVVANIINDNLKKLFHLIMLAHGQGLKDIAGIISRMAEFCILPIARNHSQVCQIIN